MPRMRRSVSSPSAAKALPVATRLGVIKRPRRWKRPPAHKQPRAIERAYFAWLDANVLVPLRRAIDKNIIPAYAEATATLKVARGDSIADDVANVFKNTRLEFEREFAGASTKAFVQSLSSQISSFAGAQLSATVKQLLGVTPLITDKGLAEQAALFLNSNVNLISSIPQQALDQVQTLVDTAIRQSWRVEDLKAAVLEKYDVTESRAALIARDQTLKYYGEVAQKQQTSLGIRRYTWRTAGDDKVRENHADKEGNVYSWDDPPLDTGHPGEDYQCRCHAEPVLDDLFEEAA